MHFVAHHGQELVLEPERAAQLGALTLGDIVAGDHVQCVQRDLVDAEGLFVALLSADPAFGRSGRDAPAVARLLVNVSIGLRVQAKITPDRSVLEDIVTGALAAVD